MNNVPPAAPSPQPTGYPQAGGSPQPGRSPHATGTVPLWAPHYGASIGVAAVRFFRKYADFTGRASRSEYWWWMLVSFLVGVVLEVFAVVTGAFGALFMPDEPWTPDVGFAIFLVLGLVWGLGTLVPNLALTWRRLHDADLAGPFFLLGLIPVVGGLIVLAFVLLPSKPEGARFDRPRASGR